MRLRARRYTSRSASWIFLSLAPQWHLRVALPIFSRCRHRAKIYTVYFTRDNASASECLATSLGINWKCLGRISMYRNRSNSRHLIALMWELWHVFYDGKAVAVEMISYNPCVCVCVSLHIKTTMKKKTVFSPSLWCFSQTSHEIFIRVRVSSFQKKNWISK